MDNTTEFWDDKKLDTLYRCWQKGYSARQTAMKIGDGATRNAVIGKAHRQGLEFSKNNNPKKSITPHDIPDNDPNPTTTKLTCQFPFGDPGEPGFHFCGEKVVLGRPYCPTHMDVCYDHWRKPGESHA